MTCGFCTLPFHFPWITALTLSQSQINCLFSFLRNNGQYHFLEAKSNTIFPISFLICTLKLLNCSLVSYLIHLPFLTPYPLLNDLQPLWHQGQHQSEDEQWDVTMQGEECHRPRLDLMLGVCHTRVLPSATATGCVPSIPQPPSSFSFCSAFQY